MLCRAVLAVLAVTCTFPPLALAIAQGTELVQLKDLVCVLWFSGLKKEDIDVNLLTKLRRHNINIDMKNETMQKECSINKLALTSVNETPVTTISTTLPTTIDLFNLTNVSNNRDFDSMVKLITDIQKSTRKSYIDVSRVEAPTLPNLPGVHADLFESSYSTQNSPIERSSVMKTETAPENVDSKVHNILSFWQSMAKTNQRTQKIDDQITKEAPEVISPNAQQIRLAMSVTSPPYYSGSTQNNPVLNRWLAEFLSKKVNRMQMTASTRRTDPSDLEKSILPFYNDLIHTYDNSQNTQDTVNGEVSKDLFNKFTFGNDDPRTFDKDRIPNTAIRRIGDISKTNERFNNRLTFDMLLKKANTENFALNEENKMDTAYNQPNERQAKRKNISKDENKTQKLPKQTIQEIVDSVKAIILKDLSPLLNVKTTPATTKVTLPLPLPPTPPAIFTTTKNATFSNDLIPTTIKPQNGTGNVYQVMDKILDLYERVKQLSDKINTSTEAKNNFPNRNEERSGPLKQGNLAATLQQNMFNRMTNVKHMFINPFRDLTRQEIQNLPSIIQTNSGEIAPLLIPMRNPLKIVNQIVVVPTAKPIKTMEVNDKAKSRYKAFMETFNNNRAHTSFETKSEKVTTPSYLEYKKYSHINFDMNHSHKDVPNKYDIIHSDLFQRPHIEHYKTLHTEETNDRWKHYNRDHNNENREHINYFDYISNTHSEKVPTSRHSEKFHEKLESDNKSSGNQQTFGQSKEFFGQQKEIFGHNKEIYGHKKEMFGQNKEIYGQNEETFEQNKETFERNKETFGQNKEIYEHIKERLGNGRENTYDRPVAPRLQQPLNTRNSPYDDTHFRNFLKTQQKVNDMLEKILETKNTLPYSVETT